MYADDKSMMVAKETSEEITKMILYLLYQIDKYLINIDRNKLMSFILKNVNNDHCPLVRINRRSIQQVTTRKLLGAKMPWET